MQTEIYDRRLHHLDGWSGRVEHVFSRAALALPERSGYGLTLLAQDRELVPYGIQLDLDRLSPQPGDELQLQAGLLRLKRPGGAVQELSLVRGGQTLSLKACFDPTPRDLSERLHGLVLPERSRLIVGDSSAVPSGTEGHLISRLGDGLAAVLGFLTAGTGQAPEVVGSLLGLGSGASPSGDDILLGCCAGALVLQGHPVLKTDQARLFMEHLADLEPGLTAQVSQDMLHQAGLGFFPQPVRRVADFLCGRLELHEGQAAVDALTRVGAQSGADMLAGLIGLARELVAQQSLGAS